MQSASASGLHQQGRTAARQVHDESNRIRTLNGQQGVEAGDAAAGPGRQARLHQLGKERQLHRPVGPFEPTHNGAAANHLNRERNERRHLEFLDPLDDRGHDTL